MLDDVGATERADSLRAYGEACARRESVRSAAVANVDDSKENHP